MANMIVESKDNIAYVVGKGYVCYPSFGEGYFFSEEKDFRRGVSMISLDPNDKEKAALIEEELREFNLLD